MTRHSIENAHSTYGSKLHFTSVKTCIFPQTQLMSDILRHSILLNGTWTVISNLTVAALRTQLIARGLDTYGLKSQLADRLTIAVETEIQMTNNNNTNNNNNIDKKMEEGEEYQITQGQETVEMFHCPVCATLALLPLFYMDCGHIVCFECQKQTKNKCPTCRGINGVRDKPSLVERSVMEKIKLSCKRCRKDNITLTAWKRHRKDECNNKCKNEGCKQTIDSKEQQDAHNPKCDFLMMSCDKEPDCGWKGTKKQFEAIHSTNCYWIKMHDREKVYVEREDKTSKEITRMKSEIKRLKEESKSGLENLHDCRARMAWEQFSGPTKAWFEFTRYRYLPQEGLEVIRTFSAAEDHISFFTQDGEEQHVPKKSTLIVNTVMDGFEEAKSWKDLKIKLVYCPGIKKLEQERLEEEKKYEGMSSEQYLDSIFAEVRANQERQRSAPSVAAVEQKQQRNEPIVIDDDDAPVLSYPVQRHIALLVGQRPNAVTLAELNRQERQLIAASDAIYHERKMEELVPAGLQEVLMQFDAPVLPSIDPVQRHIALLVGQGPLTVVSRQRASVDGQMRPVSAVSQEELVHRARMINDGLAMSERLRVGLPELPEEPVQLDFGGLSWMVPPR